MEGQNSIGHKILHFPLVKIAIGFVLCLILASVGGFVANRLVDGTGKGADIEDLATNIAIAAFSLAGYILLYRYYERRKITEVSLRHLGRNLGLGLLIGVGMQSLVVLVIYLAGGFHVLAVNPVSFLLPAVAIGISSAIFEELLFRGIIFRILEEKLGSYIALIISALVFGFIHLSNPNSSVLAATAISIEAGLMLGAAYMCTRNLWLPIAIHFGWNFAQGGIYGAAVSGNVLSKSLLQTKIEGNTLLTGGAFGPESSVQAIIFGTLVFIMMMVYCHRRGKIILPFWQNR